MIAPVPVPPAAVFGLPEWAGRLTLAGLVVAGALLLLWLATWLTSRLVRRTAPVEGPGRASARPPSSCSGAPSAT